MSEIDPQARYVELKDICQHLEHLLDGSCALGCRIDSVPVASLTDDEASQVRRSVPKRQREFAAGRWLARQCAQSLQVALTSLPSGPRREPLWPEGVAGSISHAGAAALCWMGQDRPGFGMGVDLELRKPLARDLWNTTLLPEEIDALGQDGNAAMQRFSAKESVYKAISGRVGRFVDFLEVRLVADGRGRYAVKPDARLRAELAGARLDCGVLTTPGWIASWCLMTPE